MRNKEDRIIQTRIDFSSDANLKKLEITFRKAVPEIPSTTYGTFSIFRYPAKFIPQVIAYVLKNYAKPHMKIFDPFAGYGTVGIVSRIYGCDYELWDINPILNIIHDTAIMEPVEIDPLKLVLDIKRSKEEFIPKWSNLEYWFPKEFLPIPSKAWGFAHSLQNDDKIKYLLLIPLLKTTRYFSYSDEKIHKLYSSRYAKKKIERLLAKNWELSFYNRLEGEIRFLLKKIREYHLFRPKAVSYKILSAIDTLETRLDDEVNILITSPPYMQAQEYIRSTKLELFWLGYDESFIKELSKKEIPYRSISDIEVYSETYHKFRTLINEKHLVELYDRYFFSILKAFSVLGEKVKEYMFIFVGPAKVRNMPVPIDDIVAEHLKEFGWRHEITFIDRIVAHSMFNMNVNPASGMKDSRMKTEHLVVLKKVLEMIRILMSELGSPTKFRTKLMENGFLERLLKDIKKNGIEFEIEELSDLILSACRANDFNMIKCERNKKLLDTNQLLKWIKEKLLPNTVILSIGDEDTIRLLIFCIEITYQMFAGGTRATITQKGFRQRRRTFETILVDQFNGKLGEVMLKKFLEKNFQVRIDLDWSISTEIRKYENDIVNAKKKISIKTSPALSGIWAEADLGYDYGIFVKCSVPDQLFCNSLLRHADFRGFLISQKIKSLQLMNVSKNICWR